MSFVSDIVRGLDFGRKLEILLNNHTGWDAFIENILPELLEGVYVGLRFQPLAFVECDAVGEDCVDKVVDVNSVMDLIGN